jgi:hypothetical protein
MPGYLAMTDARWAGLLQSSKLTEGINFWSPCDKPLRSDIIGSQIYFYAKPPGLDVRRVIGFGTVGDVYVTSVSDTWKKFADRNGAKTLSIFLKLLNEDRLKTAGSSPLLESSLIASHTLHDVRWLPDPIDVRELDIPVKRGTQRGRSLTTDEETRLYRAIIELLRKLGLIQ